MTRLAAPPKIQIQGVSKAFGVNGRRAAALDAIELDVAEREFLCLLGPSGCPCRGIPPTIPDTLSAR